jgi:hypothetical protein
MRLGEAAAEPHHDPAAERLMNAALVPLIVAAVVAGYLAWPQPWLQSVLAGPVGGGLSLPFITPYGLAAFALGLLGAGIAGVLERRPAPVIAGDEAASSQASGWVSAVAAGGSALALAFSRAQRGYLALYACASLCGVGVVVLVRLLR